MSSEINTTEEITQVKNLDKLKEILPAREYQAYNWALKTNSKFPPLSSVKKTELFALFLNGYECSEICRLNQGLALAQVVQLRVDDDWDQKKAHHQQELALNIQNKHLHSVMESIDFITLTLAVAHRRWSDLMKKYIQTGDETLLSQIPADMKISDISSYKKAAELLKIITSKSKGEDDEDKGANTGKVFDVQSYSNQSPVSNEKQLSHKEIIAHVVQSQRAKNDKV